MFKERGCYVVFVNAAVVLLWLIIISEHMVNDGQRGTQSTPVPKQELKPHPLHPPSYVILNHMILKNSHVEGLWVLLLLFASLKSNNNNN